jgi:hypothetical protein
MRYRVIAFALCLFFIPTVMFIFRIMSEDFKGRTALPGLPLKKSNQVESPREISSPSSSLHASGREASRPSSVQVVDEMMAKGRDKEASQSYVSTISSHFAHANYAFLTLFPQFVWKMCKHYGWEKSIIEDKAPRIFSGALFGGEFDVLEIVLREGLGIVHTHVIVENNVTVSSAHNTQRK